MQYKLMGTRSETALERANRPYGVSTLSDTKTQSETDSDTD